LSIIENEFLFFPIMSEQRCVLIATLSICCLLSFPFFFPLQNNCENRNSEQYHDDDEIP